MGRKHRRLFCCLLAADRFASQGDGPLNASPLPALMIQRILGLCTDLVVGAENCEKLHEIVNSRFQSLLDRPPKVSVRSYCLFGLKALASCNGLECEGAFFSFHAADN